MDMADGKGRRHKYLIAVAHGTYGHNDDSYGALLVANGILARGWEATMILREDGVYMALKGQDPNDIGLDNNLKHIADFVDLGGRLIAIRSALEARGLKAEELVNDIEIIEQEEMVKIVDDHDFCLTF
jgi:sulfur relay (sulfurtransferase) DsrF/TusC family protein